MEIISCFDDKLKEFLLQCEFPLEKVPDIISDDAVAITWSECLISKTGSILLSSSMKNGRALPALANAHIVIAYTSHLVDDLNDALSRMEKKYGDDLPSSMTFITGPSRTADIGSEVVIGAQGPKELFLYMIDKPLN